MVQIAAPSRTRIPSYAELRRDVEKTAERINKRFQTAYWRPIVLIEEQCSHQQVDRWYRAADICLVTSLHDGMNLVAKEYVAARSDEDGVLVLSKFTGAASELRDALLVNPYDIAAVAETVHSGLEMSRSERRLRMQHMRRYLMDHNVYRWAANVLGDLHDLRAGWAQGFGFTSKPGPISVPTAQPFRSAQQSLVEKAEDRLSSKADNTLEEFFSAFTERDATPLLLLDYDGTMAPFRVNRFEARPYARGAGAVDADPATGTDAHGSGHRSSSREKLVHCLD